MICGRQTQRSMSQSASTRLTSTVCVDELFVCVPTISNKYLIFLVFHMLHKVKLLWFQMVDAIPHVLSPLPWINRADFKKNVEHFNVTIKVLCHFVTFLGLFAGKLHSGHFKELNGGKTLHSNKLAEAKLYSRSQKLESWHLDKFTLQVGAYSSQVWGKTDMEDKFATTQPSDNFT